MLKTLFFQIVYVEPDINRVLNSRLKKRFNIYGDKHIVAHDNATFIHCRTPAHAKIVAVNRGLSNESSSGDWALVSTIFPKWRFPLTQVSHV